MAIDEKKKTGKWMKKAFGNNKGGLHKALGVPEGEKIPADKLEKASHSKDSHVRHMAQAAKNANERDSRSFNFRDMLDSVKEDCGCSGEVATGDTTHVLDGLEQSDARNKETEHNSRALTMELEKDGVHHKDPEVLANDQTDLITKSDNADIKNKYMSGEPKEKMALSEPMGSVMAESDKSMMVKATAPADDTCIGCGNKGLTLDKGGLCHECWADKKNESVNEASEANHYDYMLTGKKGGSSRDVEVTWKFVGDANESKETFSTLGHFLMKKTNEGRQLAWYQVKGGDRVDMVDVSDFRNMFEGTRKLFEEMQSPVFNEEDGAKADRYRKVRKIVYDYLRAPMTHLVDKNMYKMHLRSLVGESDVNKIMQEMGITRQDLEAEFDDRSMQNFDDHDELGESKRLMKKFGLNEEQSMGPGGGSGTVATGSNAMTPINKPVDAKAQNPESFDKADKTPESDEHGEKEYFGKQGDDNYYYVLSVEDDGDANFGGIPSEEKPDVTPEVKPEMVPADMAPVGEEQVAHESKVSEGADPYDHAVAARKRIESELSKCSDETRKKELTKMAADLKKEISAMKKDPKHGFVKEKTDTEYDYPEDRSFGDKFRAQYLTQAAALRKTKKPETIDDVAAKKEVEDFEKSWKADNAQVPNESIQNLVESLHDMSDESLIEWYKETAKINNSERLLSIIKVEIAARGLSVPVKEKKIREGFSSLQIVDASGKVVADAEGQDMDPNDIKGFLLKSMDDLELTEIAPDIVKKYLLATEDSDSDEDMTDTPEEDETSKKPDDLHKNNTTDKQRGATVAQESTKETSMTDLMEKFGLTDLTDVLLEKFGLRELKTTDDGTAGFQRMVGDLELKDDENHPLVNSAMDPHKYVHHTDDMSLTYENKLMDKFKLNEAEPVTLKPKPAAAEAPAPAGPVAGGDTAAPGTDPRDQDLTGQAMGPEGPAATIEPVTGEAGMGPAPAGGAAQPIEPVAAQDMSTPESAKAYIQSEYPEEPYTSTALAFADSMIADPKVYGGVRQVEWAGIWTDADTLEKQAKIVGDYGNFSPATVKAITDKFGNSAKYKLSRDIRPVIYLTVRDVGGDVEPTSLSELKGISGARQVVATENPGECKIVY